MYIYIYIEIFGVALVSPSVSSVGQALQGEFQSTLELLRLFAFGTYPEYKAIRGVWCVISHCSVGLGESPMLVKEPLV